MPSLQVNEHACNGSFLLYGYARGSKKFDDMAKNFLEEVARRLVAGVNRTLTLEGIEMGLDSNVSQLNYFGNHGGAVAAMVTDNARSRQTRRTARRPKSSRRSWKT